MRLRQISLGVIVGISLCLLSTVALGQSMLVPDGTSGVTYNAAYPVTINVDGNFSDWSNIPYATVDKGPMPSSDPKEPSLTFAAVSDANNLYISAQVTDSHIIAGKHGINYFNEDSVEIYINATGNPGLTTYMPGVAQITFPAANIGVPAAQVAFGGINYESLGVYAVTVTTPTGYAIEAAIPLHNSNWNVTPKNGQSIGFQVDLNSASQLDRDVKLIWSNADQTDLSYQNPSVFGKLTFAQIQGGAAAQTALLNTAVPGTTVPKTAVPTTSEAATAAASTAEPTTAVTSAAVAPTAVSGAGFTVSGSTILDPNGKPFVAKGVNVNGYNWTWTRPTDPDADLITQCWKFNLVRVNSFLFSGQIPYPQYPDNDDLDAIIKTFTNRGIVVVLEAHDRIGSYYEGNDLTTLLNWFTDLAIRYRDNPYVWFDTSNEPGGRLGIDVDNWVKMNGEVIAAIRNTAHANNVIIVEGAYGGQDAGNADASPVASSAILLDSQQILDYKGQNFGNIVFSIHTYDLWNAGDAKMADFFDRAHKQNLALIVGEYGVATDQSTQAAAQAVFDTAPSRGIGRIVWHWDGSDNNDLTVNTSQGGGWQIDNCTNPTNLSWLGQQVWSDNHS